MPGSAWLFFALLGLGWLAFLSFALHNHANTIRLIDVIVLCVPGHSKRMRNQHLFILDDLAGAGFPLWKHPTNLPPQDCLGIVCAKPQWGLYRARQRARYSVNHNGIQTIVIGVFKSVHQT
jgi:hypothetical protein